MIKLEKDELVYKKGERADSFYVLIKGTLASFVDDSNGQQKIVKYYNEKNSIFGEICSILQITRESSVKALTPSVIKKIPLTGDTLKSTILGNPKLGLSIAVGLAKNQKEINERINIINYFLSDIKKNTDKYCLDYFSISNEIEKRFQKYKFPWINEINKTIKDSLLYQMGKSVSKGKEYIKTIVKKKDLLALLDDESMNDKVDGVVFKKGKFLCYEGEPGSEMYILISGKLNVIVGSEYIAEISDKGEVIGEISILLGHLTNKWEPRTASIEAAEDSKLLVIPGVNVRQYLMNDPKLMFHICRILAKRLPNTFTKYLEVDMKLKKIIGLLNKNSIFGISIPNAFKVISEKIMKLSSGNSILDDIKEKTLEISRKSDSDYHMATRQYSVLSGHDLDKANEELQYIKIKNEEKQQEKEKNQKSNLEANEKSSSSEKSDKNVGEVYKKITRQLKVEGRINLN